MRYRKGDRVQSRRWSDTHGTVVRTFPDGESVGMRFDGTAFTEVEVPVDELWPSTRPDLGSSGTQQIYPYRTSERST